MYKEYKSKKNKSIQRHRAIFLSLAVLCINLFLVGSISAFNFDNVKSYDEKTKTITIINAFGLGDDIAEYELKENSDQCLINCYAEIKIKLNEEGALLNDLKFKNQLGEITNIKESKIYFLKKESYEVEVPEYQEVCETDLNGTICDRNKIGSHIVIKERKVWKDYNGEIFTDGEYELRIEGKKGIDETIDWIGSAFGEDFTEWAWWGILWQRRLEINITGGNSLIENFTVYLNIENQTGMQSDYDDLRFIDGDCSGIQDEEMDADLEFSNTSNAYVWVRMNNLSTGTDKICMYFNNSAATINWDSNATWDKGTGTRALTYHLTLGQSAGSDSAGNQDITGTDGSPVSTTNCLFGKCYDFEHGDNDGFIAIDQEFSDSFTVSAWLNPETINTNNYFIGNEPGGAGLDQGDYTMGIKGADTDWIYYLQSGVADNELLGNPSPTANQWYHYVVIHNGNNRTIYINGQFQATTTLPGGTFAGIRSIGGEHYDGSYRDGFGWDGEIDEVWVMNGTLWNNNEIVRYSQQNDSSLVAFGGVEFLGVITTLIFPNDGYNIITSEIEFSVNSSVEIVTLENVTLYIWNNNNSLFLTNFTNLSGSATVTTNWTISSIPDGNYIWNALTRGTSNKFGWDVNRTFQIDTNAPTINITSPSEIIVYHVVGNNLTLNWIVSDLNLNACWYNYNTTNITVTCSDNSTQFNITEYSNRNLTFYANDTSGNINSSFLEWDYLIFENSLEFVNETIEGATETFTLNITKLNSLTLAAINLNYNGTNNLAVFSSGNNIFAIVNQTAPNVINETNFTFYWQIILSNTSIINSGNNTQLVKNISIDDCSVFTTEIYNYTLVDEEEQTLLSGSDLDVEINLEVFSFDRSTTILNYSENINGTNPIRICLSLSLNTTEYQADTIVKYTKGDYAIEYYNIINFTLTNETIPQRIYLYDLKSNDSTDFQLTFTGSDFLPVENALVFVNRQYISENNIFKTVELPKTDSNGQTLLHLVRNDIIYNIVITKDGVVLGTFENLIAFCEDFSIEDCTISLNALSSVTNIYDQDSDLGITFTIPQYNETSRIISFDFVSSDGTSKIVLMNVTRNDIFGNRSVCENTLASASGTLFCTVGSNIDDSILKTEISVGGKEITTTSTKLDKSNYGNAGYLVFLIMAISFIMLFSSSKTGVLFAIGLSFLSAIGLGLITGSLIGLGASGIWLILIIVLGIWKLNKERVQ